jgi:hypothetical protein
MLALKLRARKVEDLLKLPLLKTALRVLPLHGEFPVGDGWRSPRSAQQRAIVVLSSVDEFH